MTLHITELEGATALSEFRVQQWLPRLQAVHDKIATLSARFVHLGAWTQAPSEQDRERLTSLLTYGEPYVGATEGELVVVTPRAGTVSPWASKATDIAHNCGLAVKRVERIVEYRVGLKGGLLSARPRSRMRRTSTN